LGVHPYQRHPPFHLWRWTSAPVKRWSARLARPSQSKNGPTLPTLDDVRALMLKDLGFQRKPRVAIQQWDSLEKAQAWRNSAEYKEIRKIGDKYATFRAFAVEGLPQ